jgi:hypothetical protein
MKRMNKRRRNMGRINKKKVKTGRKRGEWV